MTIVTRNYLFGACGAVAGCAHVFGLIGDGLTLAFALPSAIGLIGCAIESFFCGVEL